MKESHNHQMVIALFPRTYGFGYAIFDGPLDPLDWGLNRPRNLLKRQENLRRIKELVEFYQPDQIVIDAGPKSGTKEHNRTNALIKDILNFAKNSGIAAHTYTPDRVKAAFQNLKPNTKYERAKRIVEWLPVLSSRLPRKHKPWMREDYRLGIFEAIALALAFYYHNEDYSNDEQTIHA